MFASVVSLIVVTEIVAVVDFRELSDFLFKGWEILSTNLLKKDKLFQCLFFLC